MYKGIIYLEGETEYPDELIASLERKKASVKVINPFPIFNANSSVGLPALVHNPSVLVTPKPGVMVDLHADQNPKTAIPQDGGLPPVPQEPFKTPSALPAALPFKEQFETAGYTTMASIMAIPALTDVPGIDADEANQVAAWIHANVEV